MDRQKLVIWGSFEDYEIYRPQLLMEEWKGNIEIVAVMFLDEDVVKQVDGRPVIKVEELLTISFDYIVGLENEILPDMIKVLQMLNIPREKLLAGRIFNLPNFDFGKYLQIRAEKVSIISDNCWGGFTYHSLGMPFYSPFINLFVQQEDVIKLMQNLETYMELPLEFSEMAFEQNRKVDYPICCLGDVKIHCNHYDSYEQAKAMWDKRKAQINWQNILVKILIEDEQQLEGFQKIPYRKIGFSKIPCNDRNIIDLSGVVGSAYFNEKYQGQFWQFVNWQANSDRMDLRHYDVMKLLLGEEDYRRVVL